MIGLAQQLVECESPSGNGAAIARFVELVADTFAPYGEIRTCSGGNYGPHLICAARLPGLRTNPNPILVLGHSDTVWPLGTLRQMPFRCEDGRLWGPGVFDMKAGIVFFRFALEALKELEIPLASPVRLQLNSDEEVGSPTSRALTEANAAASRAVLVLEPGTGPKGKLKTARKGVGQYRILVRGKAAHAGLDFQTGASATLELARQLDRIAGFTNLERGITVNPGVIAGGTRPNVVAAEETGADSGIGALRYGVAFGNFGMYAVPRGRRPVVGAWRLRHESRNCVFHLRGSGAPRNRHTAGPAGSATAQFR